MREVALLSSIFFLASSFHSSDLVIADTLLLYLPPHSPRPDTILMARYDTTPPSKDYEGLSGSSSPFHSADHLLSEHTSGTVRTRAPSFVSETPEPSFPDSTSSQRKGLSPPLPPYSSPSISIPIQDTQQLDGSSSGSSSVSGSKSLRTSSNQSIHVRLLRLTWIVALFMGEYGIYWAMVNRCDWPKNSTWVRITP